MCENKLSGFGIMRPNAFSDGFYTFVDELAISTLLRIRSSRVQHPHQKYIFTRILAMIFRMCARLLETGVGLEISSLESETVASSGQAAFMHPSRDSRP